MTQDSAPEGTASKPVARGKRVRLSAEQRRQQILDAALLEFSTVGFEGATVERIAQRVGLTKAGLYAHFSSKDAILEALFVNTIFSPSNQSHWQWGEGASLEETVDRFLHMAYAAIGDPRARAIFRLLITESARSPERLRDWHEHILLPHATRRQAELDECVAKGVIPDNAVSRKFSLATAPVLIALLTQLLFGEELAEREVAEIRSAHREMLLILFARRGN
ncbi:TetR/AcrR family transcriptional regulator [Phytopseudomonas dryadis]|uniref:TetR family transcriptional regulator n=1 Tax=Phytopseudomonas dryadis TaxID=2487520 RepID=A0ABY1Z2D2_9GAMM|nr:MULTISPECIES: TetR/AcrR family transcriptional regulator [Pseudomonas]TBV02433.1 TetR family transcriptional regulator [Pseudomonas dryadis]TBV13640.1 TetR family transcriptional regulator [Pseudomonas sp. FRB 230]